MITARFKKALLELLEKAETPFYAYDLTAIEQRARALKEAFPKARLFYALKANPRLAILRRLKELGFGVEAVSLGEVLRAYRAGFLPDEVVLNGPVKTPGALLRLKEAGAPYLVADSAADLDRIARHLPGAFVLVRVNPDLPVDTHPHLATGKGESQFGVLPEEVPALYQRARELGLRPLGLHLHLGSAISSPEEFAAGYRVLKELLGELGEVRVVDLGGGFGLDLDPARPSPPRSRSSRRGPRSGSSPAATSSPPPACSSPAPGGRRRPAAATSSWTRG